MAITDPPYERYPDVTLPSILPLPPPPQGPEGAVSYIQVLHRVLNDQQVKLATAIKILAYHRSLFGDESERPAAVGSGTLFVEMDTALAYYDNPRLSTPAWGMVKAASDGSLVELDTKAFDGILSATDDDVQTAMDTIDDHTHSSFTTLLVGTLYTSTIGENPSTPASGVTIDGVLLKDYNVTANYLTANLGAYIDHIYEKTATHGVNIDGVTCKDNDISCEDITCNDIDGNIVAAVSLDAYSYVRTDQISEYTTGAGVTADGVLLKDYTVFVDTISEKTAGHGVYIDGARIKDTGASFYAQVSAAGVNVNPTAPYVDLQSSGVGNYWRIYTPNSANGSFRVMDMNAFQDCFIVEDAVGANALVVGATYLSTTKALQVDHIYEKTAAHGVDIDGVLLKDSLVTADGATLGDGTGSPNLILNKSDAGLSSIVFQKTGSAQWYLQQRADEAFRLYDNVNSRERILITADGDILFYLPATTGYVSIVTQWGGETTKFTDQFCNFKMNTSAPADADMISKSITFYNSGNTIYCKWKDYLGVTRTGAVATTS